MMMAIREKHPVNVPPCSSMRWMPSLLEMSGWAPVETMVSLTLLLHMSGSGEGVVIKVLVVTVVVEILWLVGKESVTSGAAAKSAISSTIAPSLVVCVSSLAPC